MKLPNVMMDLVLFCFVLTFSNHFKVNFFSMFTWKPLPNHKFIGKGGIGITGLFVSWVCCFFKPFISNALPHKHVDYLADRALL